MSRTEAGPEAELLDQLRRLGAPAAEAVPLIRAMSPDQQAHLFRELPPADNEPA
jgi:hypothetical protein